MILHREREVRAAHRPFLLFKLLERMRRVQFVQHVAIDVDQLAAIGALGDAVGVPDFVEQGAGHDAARNGGIILGGGLG